MKQQNGGIGGVQVCADIWPQQQQQNASTSGENMASVSKKPGTSAESSDDFADEDATGKIEGMAVEVSTEIEVFEMEMERRDGTGLSSRRSGKCFAKMDMEARDGFLTNGDPGAGRERTYQASSLDSSLPKNEEIEFFDAPDAAFSDSASEDEACPSSIKPRRPMGVSCGKMIPRLQEEIARRIKAEESVALLQMRWNEMAKRCSSIGLSISFQSGGLLGTPQDEADPSDVLSQELLVARLVGGAIARAAVRAEKEEELESMLTAKNREISRLWDKLQYLELVNREMSQRNLEVTELTQRRRRRRQRRQKWAAGCFCAAFCIGTAGLVCYKFISWEQVRAWAKPSNGSTLNGPSSTALCKE